MSLVLVAKVVKSLVQQLVIGLSSYLVIDAKALILSAL